MLGRPSSFLGCKAVCVVISFLVLLSFCWSSFLVHFKNGPEYLTRGTTQVCMHLMGFLHSSSFLVRLRYSFYVFFHLHLFHGIHFQFSQRLISFLLISFRSVQVFSWFITSIPSFICCFPLFIISMAHFSIPNSIPISSLYILTPVY